MGKARPYIYAFNTGEVSNAAMARVDQERLRLAAETQKNIIGKVIGSGQFRPGTEYLGRTQNNARARFIPFIRGTTDTALLELTHGYLRFWINDELLTRPAVSSTVTSGEFDSSTGWTLSGVQGGQAVISDGLLTIYTLYIGGYAYARQAVTTSSTGIVHALSIEVERGTVEFRCGSAAGADDFITTTQLGEGTHSLSFTPTTGTYYIEFYTRSQRIVRVSNCTIESAGVVAIAAPWSESDLRLIKSDQSIDVVFLACGSWQQRKIERRSTTSWSLARYRSDDGPFTSSRTSTVVLAPGALSGNTTMSASRPFFKTTHVGALFKLFHEGQKVAETVSDSDQFTPAVRVSGPEAVDRTVTYTVNGTWVGDLRRQRSSDGPDTGFVNISTLTTNGTGSFDDTVTSTMWYRYGFSSGDYSSGGAGINLSYSGGGGTGIARVTGFLSSTSVEIEIIVPFKGVTATPIWYEGDWSDRRGWPTAVAFHDGRLGWARGDKFWLSASDAYYTFGRTDDETITDASAIARSIATSGAVNTASWMMSLQRLVVGTQGAESVIRANSFDEPITPTNAQIKDASTQGSTTVSPARLDKRGIYVQRSGTKLYELFYNFEQQDYDSKSLVDMNLGIGGDGFYELAVQRQPETWLWTVRADGECPMLLYDAAEQVKGWMRFVTDGADGIVESVAVLPGASEDRVYLCAQRTIDGSTVRYVEKVCKFSEAIGGATNKMADSGALFAGPVSSVTMAHLASRTDLIAWATNSDGDQVALSDLVSDGSGVIDLGDTYTNIWCGLPYTGRYKSAKLAYGANGGSAILQKKRVGPIGLLLENTHPDALQHGPNFDTLEPMPRVEEGTTISGDVYEEYDEAAIPFNGEWDTDSRVCLEVRAPYPATLLGLQMMVETNE